MIRKAEEQDLVAIMNIIKETIHDLKKEGNKQWSNAYPKVEHFRQDVIKNCLYVYTIEDEIAGVISINNEENLEYKDAHWQSTKQAMIIHRFAISRNKQRQGIGASLVKFAEQLAIQEGMYYVKVDTNSKNSKMNAFFNYLGYHFCGQIYMGGLKAPFNCYDKLIKNK